MRFALYARVSTEDRQSPEDSIAWQRAVAKGIVEPAGGSIIAEYLDVGVSRSLPWPRRPARAKSGYWAISCTAPSNRSRGADNGRHGGTRTRCCRSAC